ncbi:MAG: hypothetical protein JW809_00645 [Pirellulales bacterium]|nr:hypothetical protein [Pirellulales bacterium]
MYGRWFNLAVIALWLATMTWLVTKKVLPPLRLGDPPNYEDILDARKSERPVGWRLKWNGKPIGWALSTTRPLPDHSTEIRSHVHFDRLPLRDMTPGWLRSFFHTVDDAHLAMETDAHGTLLIGPLGNLAQIRTSISFAKIQEGVSMEGEVDGGQLRLSLRSRDFSYRTTVAIDAESLLDNSLSPQTQLPGLREGQTWTIVVCNPLRYPNSPLEVLQARVEGHVPLRHDDRDESVWLVAYYDEAGLQPAGDALPSPRGRLWVRADGTVLRQELTVFDSRMSFVRLTDAETAALAEPMTL